MAFFSGGALLTLLGKIPFIRQIGFAMAGLAALGLVYGTGYFKGKWKAEGLCAVADLKAELAEVKLERDTAITSLTNERKQRKDDLIEADADQEKVRAYEKLVKDGDCPLSAGDVGGLSAY